MKLTEEQKKILGDFAATVDNEGFDYACCNYPIEDGDLYRLLCEPVRKAQELYEKLCKENGIEVGD